jgi:polysaccharide biosynthesis protein PslH
MSLSRPRLLVVSTAAVFPADNGFSLRTAELLPELSKRWRIVLIAPPGANGELAPSSWGLEAMEPVRIAGRWTYLPSQYDTAGVLAAVRASAARWKPSAALLFGGAEYVAFDDPAFPPAVADHIDCMSLLVARAVPRAAGLRRKLSMLRDLAAVAAYERRVTRRMEITLLVGERDARVMQLLGMGRGDVRVLTNGVHARADARWERISDEPLVVFTGVLDYPPNVDAAIHLARDIWPIVRRAVPDARLHLVGRRPSPSVTELARDPSVRVLADVPDLAAELQRAWVAAAPMLSGSGVKNKVLEAWAVGRPVVMTPLASNGLEPTASLASLVAKSPGRQADLIVDLLREPALREALGEESLQLAKDRFAWAGIAGQLSDILASIRVHEDSKPD